MHGQFAIIGCSDSRVAETTVLDAEVGELFVTRNVGNQYALDDLSSQTVLSYAIEHLGVEHVIVMGHTGCGSVQAAIASPAEAQDDETGAMRVEVGISYRILAQGRSSTAPTPPR